MQSPPFIQFPMTSPSSVDVAMMNKQQQHPSNTHNQPIAWPTVMVPGGFMAQQQQQQMASTQLQHHQQHRQNGNNYHNTGNPFSPPAQQQQLLQAQHQQQQFLNMNVGAFMMPVTMGGGGGGGPFPAPSLQPQQQQQQFVQQPQQNAISMKQQQLMAQTVGLVPIPAPNVNGRGGAPKRPVSWTCIAGAQMVNVATGQKSYAPGWSMNVYNADHTHYFRIPSESIMVTNGSQKYVQLYNAHGPYTKYRFQLCWENLTSGACRFRDRCSFIHCTSTSMAGVQVTDVHYNTCDAVHARHPPGHTLRVFLPNSTTEYEEIASERIIQTQGSIAALRLNTPPQQQQSGGGSSGNISSEGGNGSGVVVASTPEPQQQQQQQVVTPPPSGGGLPPTTTPSARNPQQCAHFYLNSMCTRGSMCNFIHIPVTEETPGEEEEEDGQQQSSQQPQQHPFLSRENGNNKHSNTTTGNDDVDEDDDMRQLHNEIQEKLLISGCDF